MAMMAITLLTDKLSGTELLKKVSLDYFCPFLAGSFYSNQQLDKTNNTKYNEVISAADI